MFKGSIVALITPMLADGQIDWKTFENLISWHLQEGTNGFVICGTTGESGFLLKDEKLSLVKKAVELISCKVPVIAGTGAVSTDDTCRLTEQAMAAGADGALIMSPPYVKAPQRGLIAHFSKVAETVAMPIILYNVPGRTASDILPETVAALADIPNIVGIKDATGSIERLQTMRKTCADKITFLSGDDPSACAFMLQGGEGVISVTSNIVPKLMSELCHLAVNDRAVSLAQKLDEKLADLHQAMIVEPNPIPAKWLLAELGLIQNHLRLPLVPLDDKYGAEVKRAFEKTKS